MVQEPFLGGAPGDGLDSRPLNPVVRRAVVEYEFAAPTPPGGGVAGISVVSLERGRKEGKKWGSGEGGKEPMIRCQLKYYFLLGLTTTA